MAEATVAIAPQKEGPEQQQEEIPAEPATGPTTLEIDWLRDESKNYGWDLLGPSFLNLKIFKVLRQKMGGESNGQVAERTTGKGSKTMQSRANCGKVLRASNNKQAEKEEDKNNLREKTTERNWQYE